MTRDSLFIGHDKQRAPSALGSSSRRVPLTAGEAWSGFLGEIDKVRKELGYTADWGGHRECYYRGHSNHTWKLLPGLLRIPVPANENPNKFYSQLEYDLFFEFNARARELHVQSLLSWDMLFAMQHFKAPTRLLDWTEVFGVALHFALDGWQPGGEPPCIWLLNPYNLNKHSHKKLYDLIAPDYLRYNKTTRESLSYRELLIQDKSMGFALPCAVYPEMKNNRLHAQRGSFTIHGDDHAPLEEQAAAYSGVLQKVIVPEEAIPEARKFLRQAGIEHELLFPDLEGLARSLKIKYAL